MDDVCMCDICCAYFCCRGRDEALKDIFVGIADIRAGICDIRRGLDTILKCNFCEGRFDILQGIYAVKFGLGYITDGIWDLRFDLDHKDYAEIQEGIRDICEGITDILEGLNDIMHFRRKEGIHDIREGLGDIEKGLNDIIKGLGDIFHCSCSERKECE